MPNPEEPNRTFAEAIQDAIDFSSVYRLHQPE